MIARRAVWSDERVRALTERFVPSADEVHHLQRVQGPEGKWFRRVAEQGHYRGRTTPTDTRQGIYAATPGGHLLGSINHNDPARVAGMLERAWASWEVLAPQERAAGAPASSEAPTPRWERLRPADGLVLRVTSRDLDRDDATPDWRARAWNLDNAWFRREEARAFLADRPESGARHDVPRALIARLARLHLVDNVRGQTPPFEDGDVREARLVSVVTGVSDGRVSLRLEGAVTTLAEGTWSVRGLAPDPPTPQERGFRGRLLGRATYDLARERFTSFDLLAVGMRHGATRYNGREDDPGPAPQGFALVLAGDSTADRVAPAAAWAYGWR